MPVFTCLYCFEEAVCTTMTVKVTGRQWSAHRGRVRAVRNPRIGAGSSCTAQAAEWPPRSFRSHEIWVFCLCRRYWLYEVESPPAGDDDDDEDDDE